MSLKDRMKKLFTSSSPGAPAAEPPGDDDPDKTPDSPGILEKRKRKKEENGEGSVDPLDEKESSGRSKKEKEEKKEKGKEEKEEKKGADAHRSEVKEIVDHVIHEEERTFRNYINPLFWIEKRRDYKEIRDKEKQGKSIYEVLSQGARPSMPYYILTILSCVIATAGLIQGSSATIIGAMIVAPLMTPILAFSLGVIWGDVPLIRISLTSIFKGVAWAIIISAAISYLVPIPEYSVEITSRTHPTLFDVMVALASGLVGAYGYANEKISSTLVGIAIAVALMPPLCNIGIGIGTFNAGITYGATLLFVINLVSIGLAGAVVFWIMKIHPPLADQEEIKKRAMYQIAISVVILLVISIPLSFFMVEGYQKSEAKEGVRVAMLEAFPTLEVFKLEPFEKEGKFHVNLVLTGPEEPDRARVLKLTAALKMKYKVCEGIRISFIRSLSVTGGESNK